MRIDLQAKLDGARITLQVGIGFGDVVTPAPEPVNYPVLLDDLPAPQLRACPKYTVVAEKFHAVWPLGMANTRMKDYFDLWVVLTEETLDPAELHRAVQATFARAKASHPRSDPRGPERHLCAGCYEADAIDCLPEKEPSAALRPGPSRGAAAP